jgi:hypothetical protein
MLMTWVHLRAAYRIYNVIREFAGREDPPVATNEASIFISRDYDGTVAPVPGHHDWLAECQVLIAAHFLAKFGRRYANHVEITRCQEIPGYSRNLYIIQPCHKSM